MQRREFVGGLLLPSPTAQVRATKPAPFDPDGQLQRRQQIQELHRKSVGPLFDDQGRWISKGTAPYRRELLWNAMSFLAAESTRAKGNAVIREMLKMKREQDHFVHSAGAQILIKDKGELEAATRGLLSDLVYASLKQDADHAIRFLGYNDNFPAMDTAYAVLAGRALEYAPARKRGHEALTRAADLLDRRGLFSEYTSATYSPITLLCYAEIAEYAEDRSAVALAAEIEKRVWLDLAAHFHAPTNALAGPHSRAYMVDSVGHYHQIHMVLYHVYGDRLWMTPLKYMFPPAERQVIHHEGDVPFMQVSNVWMASGTYHPTQEIAGILFEKAFPYRVAATSEYGAARMPILIRGADPAGPFEKSADLFEYPSGDLVSTTFLTQDYAVGSATAQFHDGNQTDAFFVNFRRAVPARSLHDVSTIFSRYALNRNQPGTPWKDPRNPVDQPGNVDLFADAGRIRTAQKDNTVLAVYQVKGQILDVFDALRLCIVVPVFHRSLRRLAVGGQDITARLPFDSAEPEIVWIEDDLLFAAFRPLLPTNHGRRKAMRIAEENGYLTLSFYNYEGPPKRFTRAQLLETLNGFVAEISSRREQPFATFQERVLGGKVADEMIAGQRLT